MFVRSFLLCLCLCLPTARSESNSDEQVEGLIDMVAPRYDLDISAPAQSFSIPLEGGKVSGAPSDAESVNRYAQIFAKEFSLYPPAFVKKTKLKRVVFCEQLAYNAQFRAAVPDFYTNTLYLDVKRGADRGDYQRKVIHHDYFHMIDSEDDGLLYEDQAWAALNPEGFSYGDGGANAQHIATTAQLTDKYPGFLNHYSTTGVEEDKAEMFTNMIIEPSYVLERIKSDRVLANKARCMKCLMKRFCSAMDEEFWDNAAEINSNPVITESSKN
jgi:hypothetical protein